MTQTDPAAILREELERYQVAMTTLARRRTRKTLALFCHQHLPALLSELDQLREIANDLHFIPCGNIYVAKSSVSLDYFVGKKTLAGCVGHGFATAAEALAWTRTPEGIDAIEAAGGKQP